MHSKGLARSPFIPFRHVSHSLPKVLKNELVDMGEGLDGLTAPLPLKTKCLTSLPA